MCESGSQQYSVIVHYGERHSVVMRSFAVQILCANFQSILKIANVSILRSKVAVPSAFVKNMLRVGKI